MSIFGKPKKPKESALEKELGRIGAERYADFEARWAPFEKEYLADLLDYSGERSNARNRAGVTYAQRFGAAGNELARSDPRAVNPLRLGQFSLRQAEATGSGMAALEGGLRTQQAGELGRAMQLGQGQSAAALSGLSSAAAAAGRQSILDSSAAFQEAQAGRALVGGLAGIGASFGADYFAQKGPELSLGRVDRSALDPFGGGLTEYL